MKISLKTITSVPKGFYRQRPKTWGKKERDPSKDRRDSKTELRRYY